MEKSTNANKANVSTGLELKRVVDSRRVALPTLEPLRPRRQTTVSLAELSELPPLPTTTGNPQKLDEETLPCPPMKPHILRRFGGTTKQKQNQTDRLMAPYWEEGDDNAEDEENPALLLRRQTLYRERRRGIVQLFKAIGLKRRTRRVEARTTIRRSLITDPNTALSYCRKLGWNRWASVQLLFLLAMHPGALTGNAVRPAPDGANLRWYLWSIRKITEMVAPDRSTWRWLCDWRILSPPHLAARIQLEINQRQQFIKRSAGGARES